MTVWLLCPNVPDRVRMGLLWAETHREVTKSKARGRWCMTASPFTSQCETRQLTLWFLLSGIVKVRCLQAGSEGRRCWVTSGFTSQFHNLFLKLMP